MTEEEYKKVRWFKNLMRSCYNSTPMQKSLAEKLEEIEARLGTHSMSLDGMHYAGTEHDEQLARYIEDKERYSKTLHSLQENQRTIKEILKNIQDDHLKKIIIDVYGKGFHTAEWYAYEEGYSSSGMKTKIDYALLKGIKKYEGTD